MKRFTVAVVAAVLFVFTFAAPVAAVNTPARTYYWRASYNDCRIARHYRKLSATAPCYIRVRYGAIYLHRRYYLDGLAVTKTSTVNATLASTTTATSCDPLVDTGCFNLPDPSDWHYADSYIDTMGPGGIWQVTQWYHIKLNGYRVYETQQTECRQFTFVVKIDMRRCDVAHITTNPPYYQIGARWTECLNNQYFGFCTSKGTIENINTYGAILRRTSW